MTSAGIEVRTVAHFRDGGPWYRNLDEFPCTAKPLSWFATRKGSEVAARRGAEIWESLLDASRLTLELELGKIRGKTADQAMEAADGAFRRWLEKAEFRWREESL